MNLKQITHLVFPYGLLIVMGMAFVFTLAWDQPLDWLTDLLAVHRFWWSLSIYTIAVATATVIAPLTVAVTVPFMAKIFSPLSIFIVTWIGWMIGSIIVFVISRYWGKPVVKNFFSLDKIERIHQRLPKNIDFWVLLLLRIFVPVDALSYAVGLFSSISFKKYILATGIGIIPVAFILSYGTDAVTGDNQLLLFSFLFLLLVILMSLGLFWFSHFLRPRVMIYTHSGQFHADDVTAVAVIEMILDQQQRRYKVVRTRDETILNRAIEQARAGKEVFVVDVGGLHEPEHNIFDHHQAGGAGSHDSGIQYASIGLVWSAYGSRLCNDNAVTDRVAVNFVQAIDALDNGENIYTVNELGVLPVTFDSIIAGYYARASFDDALGQDLDFTKAVRWVKQLLPMVIASAEKQVEQQKRAGQIYADAADKRMMIHTDRVGRKYFLPYEQALLVLSPRGEDIDGDWGIAIVPESETDLFSARLSFPTAWHGLRDADLQAATGVSGAIFCHRAGNFLCVANSKQAAIDMAIKTLEQHDKG